MQISKSTNANVYIDGTNNLLGRAKEITLPELAYVTEEHRALGMIGTVEFFTGLQAMVTKLKWAGFYADQLTQGADPTAAYKLQVRANIDSYGSLGLESRKALIVHLVCSFKKSPLPTLGPAVANEPEEELSTTYVKVILEGQELLEIDVHANIWRVRKPSGDMVDILEKYRQNLGG